MDFYIYDDDEFFSKRMANLNNITFVNLDAFYNKYLSTNDYNSNLVKELNDFSLCKDQELELDFNIKAR